MNEKSIGKAYLKELISLIPNFAKLLYRLAEDKRVPAKEKAILAAAAVYVLTPIDLIPDFIPFVGQVDDLLMVVLVLKRFINSVDEDILYEHWDGAEDLLTIIDNVLGYAKYFVPQGIYNRIVNQVDKGTIDVDYDVK
ncbi:MAG: YkvA family protein [Bacillota bacterium]|nr:YkvA family protein [Bacillota bacterium]